MMDWPTLPWVELRTLDHLDFETAGELAPGASEVLKAQVPRGFAPRWFVVHPSALDRDQGVFLLVGNLAIDGKNQFSSDDVPASLFVIEEGMEMPGLVLDAVEKDAVVTVKNAGTVPRSFSARLFGRYVEESRKEDPQSAPELGGGPPAASDPVSSP
jgi:hypothetical protein